MAALTLHQLEELLATRFFSGGRPHDFVRLEWANGV
jgi:hypothetical protein